jgi:hypothetical protein
MKKENLKRLRSFEGLCITANDLQDDQQYHRDNRARHNLNLHGYGIVQGLVVDIQNRKGAYYAVIDAGYGITMTGQGVMMSEARACRLELPPRDGVYFLWLFHVESDDQDDMRPVFDTNRTESARITESCAPRLHVEGEEFDDGILLCQINVYMGRMSQVQRPVPRAGRQERASESYLKPKLQEFISLNKEIISLLLRTQNVREIDLPTLSFNSALISSEFLLIEEGTTDRVLYRTAGSLVSYAHDYYNALPPHILDSITRFQTHIRKSNSTMPNAPQSNDVWLLWFRGFETTIQPLKLIAKELSDSIGPQRG